MINALWLMIEASWVRYRCYILLTLSHTSHVIRDTYLMKLWFIMSDYFVSSRGGLCVSRLCGWRSIFSVQVTAAPHNPPPNFTPLTKEFLLFSHKGVNYCHLLHFPNFLKFSLNFELSFFLFSFFKSNNVVEMQQKWRNYWWYWVKVEWRLDNCNINISD